MIKSLKHKSFFFVKGKLKINKSINYLKKIMWNGKKGKNLPYSIIFK